MNHYYLYIETGAVVDGSARFFKVAVGASRQANRGFLYLVARAASCGHYFELVSDETDVFLEKIAHSLGLRSVCDLDCTQVTARCLVKSFKSGAPLAKNPAQLHAAEVQRKLLNPDYFIMSKIRGLSHSARGNHVQKT